MFATSAPKCRLPEATAFREGRGSVRSPGPFSRIDPLPFRKAVVWERGRLRCVAGGRVTARWLWGWWLGRWREVAPSTAGRRARRGRRRWWGGRKAVQCERSELSLGGLEVEPVRVFGRAERVHGEWWGGDVPRTELGSGNRRGGLYGQLAGAGASFAWNIFPGLNFDMPPKLMQYRFPLPSCSTRSTGWGSAPSAWPIRVVEPCLQLVA